MDLASASAKLGSVVPLRLGTLKVFGDWFGRPMDNIHTAVSVESTADDLVIGFDEGETLQVTNPKDIELSPEAHIHRLVVRRADRVRWSWYYYGRPKTADNLFVEEHWLENGEVKARTTANWYLPEFRPTLAEPAVEFV